MIAATRMGDGWIWYGLGLMLLAMEAATFFGDCGGGVSRGFGHFCFQSAEKIEQRRGPARSSLTCWSNAASGQNFRFVGHTMTAFSIALVSATFILRLEGVLFFLALQHCVSRIRAGNALSE